jgi:carbamate kinase
VPVHAGGGGIPVVPDGGWLTGVEAVIDKDLTSARPAVAVGAIHVGQKYGLSERRACRDLD